MNRVRHLAAVGITGLALLGAGYAWTRQPAPVIRVRWRDDVSAGQRADLERKYLLLNGRAPNPSLAYTLLDTSRRNIERLVKDPAAVDTNDIDRRRYVVRPGTSPGPESTWVAYRIPGLRDVRVRWAVILALMALTIAGLQRDVLRLLRYLVTSAREAVPRALAAASLAVTTIRQRAISGRLTAGDANGVGDLFDALPYWFPSLRGSTAGAQPSPTLLAFLAALFVAGLIVLALGVPVLDTWRTLLLAVTLLALVFGRRKIGWWRLAAAAVMVGAIIGLRTMLPRADIAEAHNAFLVVGEGEPLQQGLPPQVFQSWKTQFEALYPAANEPAGDYTWRAERVVPKALFTRSSDAIWRKPKYTRQVDTIDFRTLGEFRGGFANELEYNFWTGQLQREAMPFYVMYELTPASVGSRLAWTGQVFWERDDGAFDEVVHRDLAERTIQPADAGHRVYAAFFPGRDGLFRFTLQRSLSLRASGLIDGLLTIAGVVLVVVLTTRVRPAAYLRAVTIFCAGYLLIVWRARHAEYLGRTYPPHSGGDDGLVHESHGRLMAMLAHRGEIVEALKGFEPAYWFTPGTRYVRMVEKLIFGDTNHLLALQIACFPIVVFYLIRQVLGIRWAWVMTTVFCLLPVGNFSLLQYITYAQAGYGEAFGASLFLLGLTLMLRTQPRWGGTDSQFAFVMLAGAALAASMFIRPNFSFAVVWLGGAYAWASWTRRDARRIIALALGLAFALWMPFHNWFYAHELYLISKSGQTVSVVLGPGDYASAVRDVIRGRFDTESTTLAAGQLKGWLEGPGFVGIDALWLAWAAYAVRLFALVVTCWVALRWLAGRLTGEPDLAVIAVASICAHIPMLFIFNTNYRYAVLAWDLSLIVLIVWMTRRISAWAFEPAASHVLKYARSR